MEQGIVVYFNDKPGKKFGFISVGEKKDRIFFHMDYGRNFIPGIDAPQFSYTAIKREPKESERVIFIRMSGKKGAIAYHWGFFDEYAWLIMNERELIYRAMIEEAAKGILKKPQIIWGEGTIHQLNAKYPFNFSTTLGGRVRNFFESDCLPSAAKDKKTFWFEYKNKDGEWFRCTDPRLITAAKHTRMEEKNGKTFPS